MINRKQKMAMLIFTLFVIFMFIGAVDATHTVKKGKYKVNLTNKEYKKLTSYETEYETVNKTRIVNKTKKVTKIRNVKKRKIDRINNVNVDTTYIDNITFEDPETGEYITKKITGKEIWPNDYVETLKSEGYVGGKIFTKKYNKPVYHSSRGVYAYNKQYDVTDYFHYELAKKYQNFTKTTYYTVKEKYSVDIPYSVKETYKVKVPYKVRKYAEVIKKIPKMYGYSKKAQPIVKNVKQSKTVGKYKYVGKSYIFGLQTKNMKSSMLKKVKKLKRKGWKININDHKAIATDNGIFKHYYYFTKKVTFKTPWVVGEKYVKTKYPLIMSIYTWDQNEVPKGKVYIRVEYNGGILKTKGYATIK